MDERFAVQNAYTERSFRDFAEFHCKKIQGIIYLKYLGIAILAYTIFSYAKAGNFDLQGFLFNPSFLLALVFIFMSHKITENSAKHMYASCLKNKGLENTVTFLAEKVRIVSAGMKEEYFYGDLYKCYETDDYFYLYVRKGVAQILEKSRFTLGDPAAFRTFLQAEAKLKLIQMQRKA